MKTGASLNRGSSNQSWATPDDFVSAVISRFGPISVDLAANESNARSPLFIDEKQDSLSVDWSQFRGLMWLNPPFENISPWAEKCSYHATCHGSKILFLTPASVGSNWFKDCVFQKAQVLFLNQRLKFIGAKDAYPKDCMLSCYGYGTGFDVWRWK